VVELDWASRRVLAWRTSNIQPGFLSNQTGPALYLAAPLMWPGF